MHHTLEADEALWIMVPLDKESLKTELESVILLTKSGETIRIKLPLDDD